jgi:copper homeostasis protein
MPITLEICVNGVESALAAQAGGADRVELCDNLGEGGTTPSWGAVKLARERLSIGLQVMIRPRGGDFCYSPLEFAVMQADIEQAKRLDADGVVLGLLHPDGTIDQARTRSLIELARPLVVTFHRAFDLTRDPAAALETLIELGLERVLTSGQQPTAEAGLPLLAALHRQAAGRIRVMAGAGITAANARRILAATGISELHLGSAVSVPLDSPMIFRPGTVSMSQAGPAAEYRRVQTSAERVRAVVAALTG